MSLTAPLLIAAAGPLDMLPCSACLGLVSDVSSRFWRLWVGVCSPGVGGEAFISMGYCGWL